MLSEEDLLRLRLASTQTPHFVHLNSAELTYSQDKGVLIKIEDIKVCKACFVGRDMGLLPRCV